MLLRKEMQRVERFSLCFSDGRNIRRPWQAPVSCERPPSILNYHPFGVILGSWGVVDQWSHGVLFALAAETSICQTSVLVLASLLTSQKPKAPLACESDLVASLRARYTPSSY